MGVYVIMVLEVGAAGVVEWAVGIRGELIGVAPRKCSTAMSKLDIVSRVFYRGIGTGSLFLAQGGVLE